MSPSVSSVTVGDALTFELWMDFADDPTSFGGVDIAYGGFTDGTGLKFVSYTPYLGNPDIPGVAGDPSLTSAPTRISPVGMPQARCPHRRSPRRLA